MRSETRDRRKATWKLLEVDGVSEAEATSTITAGRVEAHGRALLPPGHDSSGPVNSS